MKATKIGPSLPFRRNPFARLTGSLIFDRQRDEVVREQEAKGVPMRIWSGGHFRKS
jgi:hypothetical protein